jgi:hypothetical protein
MNIAALVPLPMHCEPFKRSRCKFVPDRSGCYVLATFTGVVLYVGLATSIRERMNDHLDTPAKTRETPLGRAVMFHWIEIPQKNIEKVERTWMNIHVQHEGNWPLMNKVYSPVSV